MRRLVVKEKKTKTETRNVWGVWLVQTAHLEAMEGERQDMWQSRKNSNLKRRLVANEKKLKNFVREELWIQADNIGAMEGKR